MPAHPSTGTEIWQRIINLWQPLCRGCLFFALFILDTRKRVYVFAHADLVVRSVFLQLLFDILLDYTFISSYRIDIIPAASKISAPVLVF